MTTTRTAPDALDTERAIELVTLAAYERLRVDLAIAHGTELVTWDEQNPKMRVDLRETVEPTVVDTLEVIAELGFAVVPLEWLGGPASDASAVVVDEAQVAVADGAGTSKEVDIDLTYGPHRTLTLASISPATHLALEEGEHADPGPLRGLVSGASSAAVSIVKLPQSALRPIRRVVARVLGPAA